MSRMDRYYKVEEKTNRRTSQNQDLYQKIYDMGEYSNIEGIATIDKSNEVDITKIKKMLKNREEYQKQKDLKFNKEEELPKIEETKIEDDRSYDIRDILKKAKINKPENEEYKSLDNINYQIIKELKEKNMKKEEEKELKEMIDTISNTSKLNKLTDQELGLDMFSDLKSENNTIADKDAIKKILDEVKKEKTSELNTDMDKSFFTSSLNFGKKDFEELVEVNKKPKKKNIIINIFAYIIVIGISALLVYLIYSLIK
jgi:hypothetical protein